MVAQIQMKGIESQTANEEHERKPTDRSLSNEEGFCQLVGKCVRLPFGTGGRE
jgi:hypothetical protein